MVDSELSKQDLKSIGMDICVTKPISRNDIIYVLQKASMLWIKETSTIPKLITNIKPNNNIITHYFNNVFFL